MSAIPWQEAWQQALYGRTGFYRRPEGPAGHFRTSSHVPRFAEALVRLASDLDIALGRPDAFTVVDVGAGRGELLDLMVELAPRRWRLVGVDLVARPPGLADRVDWLDQAPARVTGLLMAHELLDVVPCPVVAVDERGAIRLVLVDRETGAESEGPPAGPDDLAWLARWWPLEEIGERAEIGRPRDALWQDLVSRLESGGALAIDYAHSADDRGSGRWAGGSLVGHRRGRRVPPVPDGSCDLTAHVALDACASATAGVVDLSVLTNQAESLAALGVVARLPDSAQAATDPTAYASALQRASEARELTDLDGLGGFGWLLQLKGVSPAVRAPG